MNIRNWISDWSLKKPIYIDCYTSKTYVYKYAPIATANNFLPDWWRALPKEYVSEDQRRVKSSTMKRCAGFVDLYGKGLMVPMWSDLKIELWENGTYQFNYSDEESTLTHHPTAQFGTLAQDTRTVFFKLTSPWLFECTENIDWQWTQPIWNHLVEDNFCVLPGVINYKYTNETNINFTLKQQDSVVNIGHGTPLAHVVPLSDRPIKIRNHLISDEEFRKRKSLHQPILFTGKHYKQKKILQSQESKCPFGFGSNT
jgi:hypothetical protein